VIAARVLAVVGVTAGLAGMGFAIYQRGKYTGAKEERGANEVIISRFEELIKEYEAVLIVMQDCNEDKRQEYVRLRDEYIQLRRACGRPLSAEEKSKMKWDETVLWGPEWEKRT